jgi:hypothetical protein
MELSNDFKKFLKCVFENKQHHSGKAFEDWVKIKLEEHHLLYDYQPNGTQRPPDFIVKVNEQDRINLECKSSQKEIPMWNSSIPQHDTMYLLSSGKTQTITISLGQHHLSAEQIQELNSYKKQIKEFYQVINKKLTNDFISFYPRIAYQQKKSYCHRRDELYGKTLINLKLPAHV